MPTTVQKQMYEELRNGQLFEQAQQYASAYLEQVLERHVFPSPEALAQLAVFDEALPKATADGQAVLEMLHEYGSPATVAQLGGRYFGFVNGSAVPTGLAAKHLATYWDQNTAMQVISPLAAKLEMVVEGWLRDIFGLPPEVVAGFVSGTSSANFCALAAARFHLLERQGWNINEQGLFNAPPLRIVTGREAHSTILKAISLLGFGKQNIEWVPTDEQGRIIPSELPQLDDRTILILQAGNVNSGAFDPFADICAQARAAGAWIHIDGAFGLWAGAVAQLKHLTQGMELAHSWAVDGHKTLNTPYDSGIVMCAHREALVSALHMKGGYLVLSEERDGMFYTPEMSRRARAVELWATLRYLGQAGVDEMVLGLHQRAKEFADAFEKVDGIDVLNEVVFNQVVVACESNEQTEAVLQSVQDQRVCWVGGSHWRGRRVIRISVCAWTTTSEDVQRSVASFQEALSATPK
ncbi:MAG: aminotransferase class V-fold PLP-dependent enzyme [Bacteroidota bacterium]